MPTSKVREPNAEPDQIKLTPIQAERLGAMNDVAAKDLVGLTVAESARNSVSESTRCSCSSEKSAERS